MKKLLSISLAAAAAVAPTASLADPNVTFGTYDSMGCMLLRECTEGVKEIFSINAFREANPEMDWDSIEAEFNEMVVTLEKIGVKVYHADDKYFPVRHRGVYHTSSNNFFLNRSYVMSPEVLMRVMRHEGWHAVQDCMAGTIENTYLGIVFMEEEVPGYWAEIAANTYPSKVLPWEREAMWAGHTPGMTLQALKACAAPKPIWETYEPTPMTREWLEENGFLKS